MKKKVFLAPLLILIAIISLVSCGQKISPTTTPTTAGPVAFLKSP